MVNEVNEVLSKGVDEVIATSLSLTLLRCYSKLYLGGGQPRCCARSQREYYRKLKQNGLELAEQYEQAMTKTFKLKNYKGLIHISHPKCGSFPVNCELLGDQKAIEYLQKGVFQESDFSILPKGYKEEPEQAVEEVKEIEEKEEFQEPEQAVEVKKRGRKSQNK